MSPPHANDWSAWYRPETPDEIAQARKVTVDPTWEAADPEPTTPARNTRVDPTWEQADPAPPAWYTPDPNGPDIPAHAKAAPAGAQTTDDAGWGSWYTPDPNAPDSPARSAPPPDNAWLDAGRNVLTGLERVPGAIAGTPQLLEHVNDYLGAALMNGAGALTGHDPHLSAEDVDKWNPLQRVLPTSGAVDSAVFKGTGTKPYVPRTFAGRMGQAAVTGLGAGLVDPTADIGAARSAWQVAKGLMGNAAKTGLASGAAEGSQEVFPNTPALAGAAALLTHGGINLTNATAGRALSATARQVFTPSRAGMAEGAGVLGGVKHLDGAGIPLPGIAQVSDPDLLGAQGNVANATASIGLGLEPWQAGSDLRDALQDRVNDLEGARTAATAPILAARDSSPNFIDVSPVLATIGQKLLTAAGPQADALNGALDDLRVPLTGNIRTQADQLAASRQAINTRISAAKRAGDNATASHLFDVRNALDAQINAAVPEAGQFNQTFADYSRPLDPMQFGPVAKVLDRDQFNSRYTFPDERIPDLFLRSKATRSDLNQLVSAFGGDQDTALGALEQHLAGVASRAVNPDGTLNADAFQKGMLPYQKAMGGNLGMWFPSLAQKFGNATAAQATLDTMRAQRAIADGVANGALRDSSGAITAQSFGKWLNANSKTLATTQSPRAVMRLQQIANALKVPQGELADALKSELLPAAAGLALGGTDGGIIGIMANKTGKYLFGGLDARRQAAFNAAIEQAVRDPKQAAALTAELGKRARYTSPARALVQSAFATFPATIAGTGVPQPPPGQGAGGE